MVASTCICFTWPICFHTAILGRQNGRKGTECDRKRMPSSGGSLSESTKRNKLSPEARKRDLLLQRYPTGAQLTEDAASTESHLSAIVTELAKAKPRDAVLLPLMRSTYPSRRLFILNDATSLLTAHRTVPILTTAWC